MAVAAPETGSKSFSNPRIGKLARPIKLLAIFLLLVLVIYLIWHHFARKGTSPNDRPLASTSTIEKNMSKQNSGFLKSGDFASYQASQQDLASQYLANNDTSNAERIMNDVFKNVPAAKVDSASYSVMYQIQKAKADTTQEKKYLGAMINKLKAEGDNKTAAVAQKVLDSLK